MKAISLGLVRLVLQDCIQGIQYTWKEKENSQNYINNTF